MILGMQGRAGEENVIDRAQLLIGYTLSAFCLTFHAAEVCGDVSSY